jgi:glucose-1-phosphate cytidylyltransferase
MKTKQKDNMNVVILAGGYGTRISEYTKSIPKPMIRINKIPIIVHIMKHYFKYGFKNFYIAIGYKGSVIKNYFKKKNFPWKVKLIETGLKTMTGGRLKRLKKYLKDESFLLTYGDGLSDIDLNELINFHKRKKKLITVTAVRPPARFGFLKIKGNHVKYFKEKSQIDSGWINGGFFVIEPKFIDLIKNDKTYLEREPLEIMTKKKQLVAYKHHGFWQCMDTVRDKEILEKNLRKKKI